MKLTKKMISLLVVCMLVVAVFPFTTFASKEERVLVYVNVPKDWEAPSVWAFNEDGTNAFDSWPGEELEADSANEGWYYCWLPVWADNIIINANGGTVQIEALKLEGGNAWITITDPTTVEVSYEAKTKGEAPEFVEKFKIHAIVPESWETANLWAWSAPDGKNAFEAWPGKEMRKGEDGTFVSVAPIWVNSIIINGNEGTVQTEDISLDAAEVWITISEDNSYELSYDDPAKASAQDITVNVLVPTDWSAPCLWAWSAPDGTNAFATWPGEPLTAGDDGWYSLIAPGWINSVIVNGNEGAVQTTDVSVEAGKDIWLVVTDPDTFSLTYEKPEGVEAPTDTEVKEPVEQPAGDSEVSTPTENKDDQKENNTVILLAVIAAVIICAGGIGVYKAKKK